MYENQVLAVNKYFGWTSFQVVKTLQEAFHLEKVGHAGSLDPLAEGLLIVCTNRKTKAIADYQAMDKVYEGTLDLGRTTPSFDLETDFDSECGYDHITSAMMYKAAKTLEGNLWQVPPAYSAIKQNGQRAYKRARKGESVRLAPRSVHVHSFEITGITLPTVHFRIHCGKGVYIRSMVHDFGQLLGVGAVLTSLVRVQIGAFHLRNAYTVRELICQANPKAFQLGTWGLATKKRASSNALKC